MAQSPDVLTLRYYPDPVLRQPAERITEVTDEVRAVAQRMVQLMHEHRGVGLAGPQVGVSWRLFVANVTGEPGADEVFINPKLSSPTPETEARDEGCLSLPQVEGQVTRPVGITIEAWDEQGQPFQRQSSELAARVWQHETDHLDGTLIIDRMPRLDRMGNKRALRELETR
jgi:peptide deformylase